MDDWEGWEEVTAVHSIHLPPVYLSPAKIEEGVNTYLQTYLHRYDPTLKSIPVAFSRVDWSLAGAVGKIINDSPQVHFDVRVRWTCFTPQPGLLVKGTVSRIDASGLVVCMSMQDPNMEVVDLLSVFVPSADLREEWQFIDYNNYNDAIDNINNDDGDWEQQQKWEALSGAQNQVPMVGAQMTVVVSGPGGPTGILGKLKRVKRVKDGFTVTS